jgi:uncharacterized protein
LKLPFLASKERVSEILNRKRGLSLAMARQLAEQQHSTFFDIESLPDQRRLQNPELMLGSLTGLVVLDEIQGMPELFPVLRVLVDRPE